MVIVGAGFGGLAAATALKHSAVQVTIIDRRNYHLFQPLLYQAATAALSPADIAQPIHSILRRQCNATVLLVVSLNWLWAYLTLERGFRLITGPMP